jgi:hypothetical protein
MEVLGALNTVKCNTSIFVLSKKIARRQERGYKFLVLGFGERGYKFLVLVFRVYRQARNGDTSLVDKNVVVVVGDDDGGSGVPSRTTNKDIQ